MDQEGHVKEPVHVEAYLSAELGPSRDVIVSIFCGAIAGVVAKTVVAPVERVKMRYQISSDKFTLTKGYQYGRDIINRRGIMSLWKGHSTTVIRVAPLAGISFAAHDYAELEFKQYLKTDTLPFIYKFLAGSIGGATGTFFTYPLDVIRVRLALTPGSNWYSVLTKQGGFYQGLTPTMLGIIPYSGINSAYFHDTNENFVTHFCYISALAYSLFILY
jgi:solute carrier family 25 protein 42